MLRTMAQSKQIISLPTSHTTERKRSIHSNLYASLLISADGSYSLICLPSTWSKAARVLQPMPATKATGRKNHSHYKGQIQFCGTYSLRFRGEGKKRIFRKKGDEIKACTPCIFNMLPDVVPVQHSHWTTLKMAVATPTSSNKRGNQSWERQRS